MATPMLHPTQPTLLPSAPSATDFTPLSDHEAATPASFFGAPPVLHAALGVCDLLVAAADTKRWDVLRALADGQEQRRVADGDGGNGNGATASTSTSTSVADMLVVRGVGGFVTSSSLILTGAPSSPPPQQQQTASDHLVAISIPYPCISLHATQRLYYTSSAPPLPPSYATDPLPDSDASADTPAAQAQTQALYLQLDMDPAARENANPPTVTHDNDADGAGDEEYEDGPADALTVEILLVPQAAQEGSLANGATQHAEAAVGTANEAKVREVFEALSRCADLHPDPALDEGEGGGGGGGLAALMGFGGAGAGAGQWITAENAHEFEGEFGDGEDDEETSLGTNGLGPGAGRRRARDDGDDDEAGGEAAGAGGDGDEGDETKWQRTG